VSEREPLDKDSRLTPTSAVLDQAHLGDIHGAFGTIRLSDVAPRRTWRRRLLTLAAIVGPGIIVMVGDNDAGGVSTYAQAGQNYGYSLLWTLVLLIPVLIVNQEMVVRLGAVTGVGHARLIKERFGRFWAWFSVGDLFLLNFLTIATEFIGIGYAGQYFGYSPYLVVPLAALILVGITVTGNFRRWERAMFVFVAASLLVFPLVILSHPDPGAAAQGFVRPSVLGGFTSNAALLIIAVVGTTVAPWQLFFQQSNVIDKRITPRWLDYEKADTVLGAFVVVIGAACIMMASASAFTATSDFGHQSDRRRDIRPASLRRFHRRRVGRHACDLVCVWRHLRPATFAAPWGARSEALLQLVHGDGGAGGSDHADSTRAPRIDHYSCAGARRNSASKRNRLPRPSV